MGSSFRIACQMPGRARRWGLSQESALSIHVALHHVTRYRYDRRVSLSPQVVRLRPAPHCRTPIVSYSLKVEPAQHFINWQQDPFSNHLARLVFPEKTSELTVTVDLVTEAAVYNPFDFFLEPAAEQFPFAYEPELAHDLAPYLAKAAATPRLQVLVDSVSRTPRRIIDFLVEVNQRLQQDIAYLIRLEPGVQTPEETLLKGCGSCRDTAWLLVQLLRHLGLAARFVSGYLIQLVPDVKALDGPSGADRDFTDLHAWCEVYLPGAGWVGLDPTSGLLAGEGHIPVACTPEPSTAAPISGAVDECEVSFEHEMTVTRVHESPRVTKPYTGAQWAAIKALGHEVDHQLNHQDVRLTMGGEPTFVAVADRDAAEWNTAALGPTKRGLANELTLRLMAHYGQGGFLHFGQGKWYPGEQLPRWALSIAWRADGQACWGNPALFADERETHHYTVADAQRLVHGLANRLGLANRFAQAAYEDAWYFAWREGRLPVNVDVLNSQLDDAQERARLARVFDQGLNQSVGYVLPLKRNSPAEPTAPKTPITPTWSSDLWPVRGERLCLTPGDSPMGYRLPLDTLPWIAPAQREPVFELDPFAAQAPLQTVPVVLPDAPVRAAPRPAALRSAVAPAAAKPEAEPLIRTALCVEVRNPQRAQSGKADKAGNTSKAGVLYVFMPPLVQLEDYLELLAAVEATAQEQGVKLVLEGYPPPRDVRLKLLQVTPDPGVIEVNIHPAHNWDELVDHTEFLYDAAHQTRLSTEKFMLDGRHTGTGGGNHFVLGGATPTDSPFLRRPDVLASLLAYWHNHPSLSYLFSGMFIGPTSQAPRIDEARNDQVYELEIALAEIENQLALHGECPPWMVDRALRNLLVDVSGNTHRSEFSIDKLYSPDGPTGRLGLLELRAFEMPPHAHMSLAQQLLLRALVARFWREPYKGGANTRLTRWGTTLHDRFLLPTFVQMDLDDVITELQAAGFAFDAAWFAPHLEFRFPALGEHATQGVRLNLRAALEPWHVLGEEGAAGGTARYVDSSLERLELKVSGLNSNRHAVTVNGVTAPLQATGRAGELVCGVRFKAWQPWSALHPTINSHAPLTFDIVDLWLQRSIGGCRYHVAHPGGRNYDSFPINAYEAESRRLARFFSMGHTPGPMSVKPASVSPEFPFTLDLRQHRPHTGVKAAL
jgi:uncharacterized protein (DUF2126 family)/transglutaminase-like putative cysteine protease